MPKKLNAAFWKWFGDSVVRNEDGTPMVVYHGTQAKEIREFRMDKKSSDYGDTDLGFFFSGAKQCADEFGTMSVAAYLSMKNPVHIDALEFFNIINDHPAWYARDFRRLRRQYIKAGHDGIIVSANVNINRLSGPGWGQFDCETYIVFRPEQIKSIDNDGTWDADDPDIRSNPNRSKLDVTSAFTLPAGTILYHGTPEPYASQIRKTGKLIVGLKHKLGAGSLSEGGLIWFATERHIAERYASGSESGRHSVADGAIFSYELSEPLRIAGYYMKLSLEQANILNAVIPLPDYKALDAGTSLNMAAYRAHTLERLQEKYPHYQTSGGEMMVIWPTILRAIGFDAYAYGTGGQQIAMPADSLAVRAGNPLPS